MTGKERFLAAFRHEAVDRVPLMEQSVASTVASALLGRPALTGTTMLHRDEAEAWLAGDEAHEEFMERVLRDNVAVADLLGHDAVSVPWLSPRPTKKLTDTDYLYGDEADGQWCIRRYDPESRTFGVVRKGGVATEADLQRDIEARERALEERRPGPEDFVRQARLAEMVGDRMEVVGSGGIAIPLEAFWLEMVALRPDLIDRHLDVSAESAIRNIECQAAMGRRVLWAGGDLADNHGPLYGPKVFREMVLPRVQRITRRCHELGLLYLFRTDGNLWSIGDDFFVASGIHAYGEIDVDAGMDLVEIRRRYPKVALWGGLSCGRLLHHGTVEEVRAETRRVIDGLAGRGLILGSSNSILHGTPPGNVLAMVDESRR